MVDTQLLVEWKNESNESQNSGRSYDRNGKAGKGRCSCGKMSSALGYYACGEFLQVADDRSRYGIWNHGLWASVQRADLRGRLQLVGVCVKKTGQKRRLRWGQRGKSKESKLSGSFTKWTVTVLNPWDQWEKGKKSQELKASFHA